MSYDTRKYSRLMRTCSCSVTKEVEPKIYKQLCSHPENANQSCKIGLCPKVNINRNKECHG